MTDTVIHPPCWHPSPPTSEPAPLFSFDMLYIDEFVALGRLTFRLGTDVYVHHFFHDDTE